MPFSRKEPAAGSGRGAAEGSAAPPAEAAGKKGGDLLIRFFESDFFDATIALMYLYKSNSQGVQDYLCNRLYTLPEREVERYLSQLTQLCMLRPGTQLERVIIALCAQSLRIAVKAYWLLLAISQDLLKDTHVAALRDACEQAALEGHWQLPFKQSRLPPLSPAKRSGALSAQRTPSCVSPNTSFAQLPRPHSLCGVVGGSPEPRRVRPAGEYPSTPDTESRPMSPDGLGGGIFSSVFMDTGVEGLIYGGEVPDEPDVRTTRHHVGPAAPHETRGLLLEGPGRPLLPVRADELQRVSSLHQELGAGEGVSALLLRSSTAGEGGGPGVVQQSDDAEAAAGPGGGSAAALFSPPNSPRRRQTTFGATLDFVETLCQASSSLNAFQPEDRQWALKRALQQINVEIEKATRNGVAIWFPLGDSNLRVVRLAAKESRLLNSREKAPFTLCVEVLDEEEAAAAAEARAAERAALAAVRVGVSAAAGKGDKARDGHSGESKYADSAKSLMVADQHPPALQLMQLQAQYDDEATATAAAAAAAEAAAAGIQFVANHHRTHSQDTSISSMDAAALAAVQGSSAVTGDSVAAAAAAVNGAPCGRGSSTTDLSIPSSPRDSLRSGSSSQPVDVLASELSLAAMLPSEASLRLDAAGSGGSGGSSAALCASPARPRRLTEELDAVSEVPSFSAGSSILSSPHAVDEDEALLRAPSPISVQFDHHPQQHHYPPLQQQPPEAQLPRQMQALNLSPLQCSKQMGGGTWIGGGGSTGSSPVHPSTAAGAAAAARRASGGGSSRRDTVRSSLETALAGLRGEAPLVSVRLEVLNDTPLPGTSGSTHSSSSGSGAGRSSTHPAAGHSEGQQRQGQAGGSPASADGGGGSGGSSSVERRRASMEAAGRLQHQCDRSSWACKLGLCKLCNTRLATVDDEPWRQPTVRVHFTVQGGVDLTIRKTLAKHQRMPSHEALLKVAKQHKLPAPELGSPLPVRPGPPQQQQQVPVATAVPVRQQQPQGTAAAAAGGPGGSPQEGSSSKGSGNAVLLGHRSPAEGSSPAAAGAGAGRAAVDSQALAQQATAVAAYGEKWQARKERVQLSSPHGRRPGWDLQCVIVKTGDDCRQELLAMQLIRTFHEIFAEAQLPLWLRPYEVLPTSNRTALIEMVPNAPSIHAIKSKSPPGTSLREHLAAKFVEGSPAFLRAQRNFVESLAAYSVVCYLLQIKDRHNGNILLDDEGHLIHIDFGFMLSNSPGGVNFESAPFKLTRELLEVMDSDSDGKASELFDYFKVLMIQGFLAVRKHADRILLLVEMMQTSGCPCFKSRLAAVQGLKKRFNLPLPEPQLVEVVLGLISDSLDAWRTRQYDYYQRVLNGIL